MERVLVKLDTEALTLRALLNHVIDYAGLYPPAALPLPEVVANYERYRVSPEAWMLNRLVLPRDHNTELGQEWRVTLLTADEPGPLPPQIETLETKAGKRLSLPTYCEAPLDRIEGGYAKIRCSGITSEALADFLCTAAERRLPFKATAGLHHPIRTADAHGFLNVFTAATLAWFGVERTAVRDVLDDTDIRLHKWPLSASQIAEARRDFAHSFGSCSFEEPVNDLRALGLIA